MKFLCLGYADERLWDTMSESEQRDAMEECFAYDDVMRDAGDPWAGGEALQSSGTAKTLRWDGRKVVVTDGPYAETKEQLGGFGVLEVSDMEVAVDLMSKHPGLRLGPFEIRPVEEGAECLRSKQGAEGAARRAARFLCLGYMEERHWDAMAPSEQDSFMKECLVYDATLFERGHMLGGEALQSVTTAKTVRMQGGKTLVTDGPYAETKEQLGGVVVIAAEDMKQAVELMSKHPGVRVGMALEIRPADESINELIAAREQRVAARR
jgi:hypothetical protein